MKKTAVVYYSWSGNTAAVAGLIHNETGGRLLEISPSTAYPSDYRTCVIQAKKEIQTGFMPELKTISENLDGFDLFFIGTPVWWNTMAPPVLTFLKQVNWSGKTLVPFCTHGGGGKGHFIDDVRCVCGNAALLDELVLYGSGGAAVSADIRVWANRWI